MTNEKLKNNTYNLSHLFPEISTEWDYENNYKTPKDYTPGSSKKVWWKCLHNHKWESSIEYRTRGFGNCPTCCSLSFLYPKLALEVHPEKNGNLDLTKIKYGSSRNIWWLGKCSHEWKMSVHSRTSHHQNCPFCYGRKVLNGFNDFTTKEPIMSLEWCSLNTTNPENTYYLSTKEVKWKCHKNHIWKSSPQQRILNNKSCNSCNSIISTNPEILQFWKNDNKENILNVNLHDKKKYSWFNKSCGHSWLSKPFSILNSYRKYPNVCFVCTNMHVKQGINDVFTTHPNIIKHWNFSKNDKIHINPYNMSYGSQTKVWLICKNKHEWKAVLSDNSRNIRCPKCQNTISKAELEINKYLSNIQKHKIQTQDKTILKGRKSIDIYIRELNLAIEFNGIYWHSDLRKENTNYHYDKWKECANNDIQLIQIWEDDWNNNQETIIKYLYAEVQIHQQKEDLLSTQKAKTENINEHDASKFFNNYHIDGYSKGNIHIAIKIDNEIISAISITKEESIINIERYATKQYIANGLQDMLSEIIKEHNISQIIYTTNNSHSNYEILKKAGFHIQSEIPPDYMYVKNNKRIPKYEIEKMNRTDKEVVSNSCDSENKVMSSNPGKLPKIWDAGKIQWVKQLIK